MDLNKLIQIKDHLDDIKQVMENYDSKYVYRSNHFIIHQLVESNLKACNKFRDRIDKIQNDGTYDKIKWVLLAGIKLYMGNSYQVIEFIDYIITNKEPIKSKKLALSDHMDQAKIILDSEANKLIDIEDND